METINATFCPTNVFSTVQKSTRLGVAVPLAILGVLTNSLNIIVFAHSQLRRSKSTQPLIALSLSDLLLCVANLAFLQLPVLAETTQHPQLLHWYPVVLRYAYPLGLSMQTSTVYLTVLVSLQRYVAVCHPLRAQRYMSHTIVCVCITCTLILSVLACGPRWWDIGLAPCTSVLTGQARHMPIVVRSFTYNLVYNVIGYTILMFVLPFVVLAVVKYNIQGSLHSSQQLRSTSTSKVLHSAVQAGTGVSVELCGQSVQVENKETAPEIVDKRKLTLQQLEACHGRTLTVHLIETDASSTLVSLASVTRKKLQHRKGLQERDKNVNRQMLTICYVFMACNSVAFGNNVLELGCLALHGGAYYSHLNASVAFQICVELGNILVVLNSASTIFVYLMFNSKYVSILKGLFGGDRTDMARSASMNSTSSNYRHCSTTRTPDQATFFV